MSRSDDEILALPDHALTQEERNKAHAIRMARLRSTELEVARLQGKQEALREMTLADPNVREILRVKAWIATDTGSKQIRFDHASDSFTDVPDEWPEGMDPDEAVRNHIDTLFNTTSAAPKDDHEPQGEGVTALRKLLGDD